MRIYEIAKTGSAFMFAAVVLASSLSTSAAEPPLVAQVTPVPEATPSTEVTPEPEITETPEPTPTPPTALYTSVGSASQGTDAAYVVSGGSGMVPFGRRPFQLTLSVQNGYDDNISSSSTDRHGTWFTNENVTLSYDFGTPRTQINLRAGGGIAYYFDRPGDRNYDLNGFLALLFTHKISPRLILSESTYLTYQVEPDFALDTGLDRRSGNYLYTSNKFSVAYNWAPRFSTITSYTLSRTSYDDQSTGFFEDRFEHTFGNEFRFLAWPTTTLVGEYRFQIIDYDGFPRDSTTNFLLTGLDHNFSPRFNVSLRGGVEFRSYDNFGDRTDPYFESTLTYQLARDSFISWTNHYGIEEPDVLTASSRTAFRTGLQVQYGVTQRIMTKLGFYYEHDENSGGAPVGGISSSFAEDSYALALSAQYSFNRNWAVATGYDFTDVESGALFRSYSRNRVYLGLNFNF